MSRSSLFVLVVLIGAAAVVLIGGIVAFAATRILGGGDRAKVNLAKAQVQTLAEKGPPATQVAEAGVARARTSAR